MPSNHESKTREKLLATTLASIGDGVIATDTQGRVTLINGEAERLTGWSQADALGRPLSEIFRIINELSRAPVENPVEKVLRLGKTVGLANHTVLISKDGTETPIDDSAAPIRNDDGTLAGVVLVFCDDTRARKAQQESARLAAIVEYSGDAILTKNLDGIIQSWNAGAERIFGYRAEEAVGKSVTILFPPDRLKEEDDILGQLRQGKPFIRLETIRLTKDRRPLNVSVGISPLKDSEGNVTGASKIIHDTTEIVQAREALEREKEWFATTLASIGDAVITTDAQGKITFLNAEAERMTGWKSTQAQSQPLPQVFKIVNEKSRKTVENPVEKVLRDGYVVGLANHTVLIARDGSECPIDDSAAPIRHANGPLFGVVLVFRDFTARRQAEQALRHAQQQLQEHASRLEATVAERTVRLTEMVSELQQVSYSITHDMRAPVRAMGAFAQLLLDDISKTCPSSEREGYCQRILTGADRLDKLIKEALNYTKAVLEQLPLEPVALSPLLRGLIETYPNLTADVANIRVDDPLPIVLGNESLLTQCFSNLLGNAVKFVAPGARPEVRVWSEPAANGFIRVNVEDKGVGIPQTAQPRLFGMFQKLDNQYEGTGIGLAIVRKVVERMGGRVGAESSPGIGSRFWVELRAIPPKTP